jgi:hypothetical protein
MAKPKPLSLKAKPKKEKAVPKSKARKTTTPPKPKKDTLETPRTPLKAIRAKCLDCSCFSHSEIDGCLIKGCPLYPFRFGKDPYAKPVPVKPKEE